eukprot:scaffold362555_cov113-Cyclotella_meneghiniana.AAC.1
MNKEPFGVAKCSGSNVSSFQKQVCVQNTALTQTQNNLKETNTTAWELRASSSLALRLTLLGGGELKEDRYWASVASIDFSSSSIDWLDACVVVIAFEDAIVVVVVAWVLGDLCDVMCCVVGCAWWSEELGGRTARGRSETFLNPAEVQERVITVVKNFDKVDPSKVSATSKFGDDLGLDSLDAVEVVMAIEDEFAIEIPDAEADRISSVGDAVEYVAAHPMAK